MILLLVCRKMGVSSQRGCWPALSILIALGAFCIPCFSYPAGFDLDADGKQETHLISECRALIAFKQTITHTIKNGLPDPITVNWPAAGIHNFPVAKGRESTVVSYETYKSCIPAEDRGVEFKIRSEVRKFDRGAPAATAGFVTRWFYDAVEEMALLPLSRKLQELVLTLRTIIGGRPFVSVASWVSPPPRPGDKFHYQYAIENSSTNELVFLIKILGWEGRVSPGKTESKTVDSQNKPSEEATVFHFKSISDPDWTVVPFALLR